MAEKRMFTKKITNTDAFLSNSLSAQSLYFHFNMNADDDGFVANPKTIMKMIGANEGDFNNLVDSNFIIPFISSGIVVIKHWNMHNTLKKDRYKPTAYIEEKNQLLVKENKSYSSELQCIPNGSSSEPQYSKEESSKDKYNIDKDSKEKKDSIPFSNIKQLWNSIPKLSDIKSLSENRKRHIKARISETSLEDFYEVIENVKNSKHLKNDYSDQEKLKIDEKYRNWKCTFDWIINPSNYLKILEGNYKDKSKNTRLPEWFKEYEENLD